jgi:short-subunit dehydrogenase
MKNILVIGATSAIAEQYARLESASGCALFLVGRDARRLDAIAGDLSVRDGTRPGQAVLDVDNVAAHEAVFDEAWASLGHVDVALLAHGTLPDQAACDADLALALAGFATNGTATIALMHGLARRMRTQGHGTIAVISSVAGDRGRASNFLYGSAKAAVTAYASGLRQQLAGNGVNVLTIKPGFVDTPMTAQFRKGPLWASPQKVAAGIVRAVARRRAVAYLPWFWWPIMQVITHIPESIFRKVRI